METEPPAQAPIPVPPSAKGLVERHTEWLQQQGAALWGPPQ